MRQLLLVTLLTIGAGLTAFVVSDQVPSREYVFAFSDKSDQAPLTTIQGIPFPASEGRVVITEPMAHLRIPFEKTVLGKRLMLRIRFRPEVADSVDVGVKKGEFWLDYHRQVLFSESTEQPQTGNDWIEQEREFDLSSAYLAPDGSLELMLFVQHPKDQPRLVLDELRLRVEPSFPNVPTLARRIRQQLSKLLRRPPVASLTP